MSNGRLMITMASAFHAGEIACVASNVEGTTSSLATLTVLCKKMLHYTHTVCWCIQDSVRVRFTCVTLCI